MKILVTGAAGFIGYHVCTLLLKQGHLVTGIDNLSAYYDLNLKKGRLQDLGVACDKDGIQENGNFSFQVLDMNDRAGMEKLFVHCDFDRVIHLAAQPGVRYSVEQPESSIRENIMPFLNLLECCVACKIPHTIFASSSSVYGLTKQSPFTESDPTSHTVSIYAASKKMNEQMAHTYSKMYQLPLTGLRFFTVYGPWGRPDMAIYLFSKALFNNEPLKVFNNGEMARDFTYVDDITHSISLLLDQVPQAETELNVGNSTDGPFAIYNIGSGRPTRLMDFIDALENETGKKANIEMLPMQKGDVVETFASIDKLDQTIAYRPQTKLEDGIRSYVEWFKEYYQVN